MAKLEESGQTGEVPATKRQLPRAVWAVGFVSMFMDISSEMIHSLLPVFLATTLAAPVAVIGIIEGVSEATASLVKLVSGRMSDWLGRRKPLLVIGYGLAALSKPLFPIAEQASTVLVARFADRVGKGIRGAPRDALIADIVPKGLRGAAYGLRQSLDTIGAVIGPLLAMLLLALNGDNVRGVFWLAAIPAVLSVFVILAFVPESSPGSGPEEKKRAPLFAGAGQMPSMFWFVLLIAALLQAARPSEGFILLRASNVGLGIELVPLGLVAMNIAFALSAYPAGVLSDRLPRSGLIAAGTALIVVSLLLLGFADRLAPALSVSAVIGAASIWGLHLGLTQGLLAAMVADQAPANLRGTAFGLFHLTSGLAMLPGNAVFGWIWDWANPATAFFISAGASALTLLPLFIVARLDRNRS